MRRIAIATLALAAVVALAGSAAAQPAPVGGDYDFSVDWTSLNEKAWRINLEKF